MNVVGQGLLGSVNRVAAYVQNGVEVLRFGGLDTGERSSPYRVVDRQPMYRLRRYFADESPTNGRPPVVLVHPMMLSAELWDVSPSTSTVAALHAAGIDPWVVDFGSPEREVGGLDRTMTDHVIALSDVIDTIAATTGADVHVAGYCQGGLFCYQAAAYRRTKNIASVITFGSPTDFFTMFPAGLPKAVVTAPADLLAEHVFSRISIPAWAARLGFNSMDPVKTVRTQFDFLRQLHDREALVGRERQRRFMTNDGYVGWSGPAIVELVREFIVPNRMMVGGFVVGDRAVSLADITCPILAFIGERDEIGQPEAVRGIGKAATATEVFEVVQPAGHLGLVLGSNASRTTWPLVTEWIRWREGSGPPPALMQPMRGLAADSDEPSATERTSYALAQVADIGTGVVKHAAKRVAFTRRASQSLLDDAAHALPRLIRLGRLQGTTEVSFAALLADRARRDPEGECFLFDGRVHTNAATSARVDNVVRGLISVGVRQGDHVGVLMETRPSALVAVAALSRLGAVAVMLPPDDVPGALRLAPVAWLLVDPTNVDVAGIGDCRLLVLGGGESRTLSGRDDAEVIDLEQIDPARVVPPAWYRPNPGTARDLAFVLFSTTGGVTRRRLITNRRWALAAFGTASAAALSRTDTVYCLAPLHHPAGLLTTVGSAMAGGARIALSRGYDPARFEEEVRRYGVTVVSYTWTMLRELVSDPNTTTSRPGLPIRLFVGSGMPVGLWNRVAERFAPAQVLELWATTEGDAVLANVSGKKPGAKGRPLPGSAEVTLARYDPARREMTTDEQGLRVACRPGEIGLLLANSRAEGDAATRALRGVFRPGDRWLPTGDLFRQDAEGDFWLVGSLNGVIETDRGPVFPQPICDALGSVEQIDLAVVHEAEIDGRATAVAAVTLWPGGELTAADLDAALQDLPPGERPDLVHVVEKIAVTASFRPDVEQLATQPVSTDGPGVWTYDPVLGGYAATPAGT